MIIQIYQVGEFETGQWQAKFESDEIRILLRNGKSYLIQEDPNDNNIVLVEEI